MRLLNVEDFSFREFHSSDCPRYAILSHTWDGEETTHQEFRQHVPDRKHADDLLAQIRSHQQRPGQLKSSASPATAEEKSSLSWPSNLFGMAAPPITVATKTTPGLLKIIDFATYVRNHCGLSWIWVDTCCINKESSAELSEAINSMYRWYRRAEKCLVHLSDVSPNVNSGYRAHRRTEMCLVHRSDISPNIKSDYPARRRTERYRFLNPPSHASDELVQQQRDVDNLDSENNASEAPLESKTSSLDLIAGACNAEEFLAARWFRRGWTLQELLAPRDLDFYTKDWQYIGKRYTMPVLLSRITGINVKLLSSSDPAAHIAEYSVAERMSWAAHRQTKREEDIAYSLLGIFGIHMSLLYGEGENAFFRLQKKILKTSPDETIFAWDPATVDGYGDFRGLLAPHPKAFSEAKNLVTINMNSDPISITSRGAGFTIFNQEHLSRRTLRVMLPLNCSHNGDIIGIPLARWGGTWYRVGTAQQPEGGLVKLGRHSTVPIYAFDAAMKDFLYVSTVPTPTPVADFGFGGNYDPAIETDKDDTEIDTENVELLESSDVPFHVAVRFRTHVIPWQTLSRSIDHHTATKLKQAYPEIVETRDSQYLPVEMTDTGKELVVTFAQPPGAASDHRPDVSDDPVRAKLSELLHSPTSNSQLQPRRWNLEKGSEMYYVVNGNAT